MLGSFNDYNIRQFLFPESFRSALSAISRPAAAHAIIRRRHGCRDVGVLRARSHDPFLLERHGLDTDHNDTATKMGPAIAGPAGPAATPMLVWWWHSVYIEIRAMN